MPLVGFEPMTPVFELAKTLCTLDRAATVIGGIANTQKTFMICNINGVKYEIYFCADGWNCCGFLSKGHVQVYCNYRGAFLLKQK
jgi:hypothetical protein